MFEKIKKIKQLAESIERENAVAVDDDGRSLIEINVSDDSGFLSPYSVNSLPLISSETADFLNHSIRHVKADSQLNITFVGSEISQEERPVYERAVHNYYRQEFLEKTREVRKNTLQSMIMLIMGIVVFAVAILLSKSEMKPLFLNILDVVAWVFVWESVDLFFFRRPQLRKEQLRGLKILTAKIEFAEK